MKAVCYKMTFFEIVVLATKAVLLCYASLSHQSSLLATRFQHFSILPKRGKQKHLLLWISFALALEVEEQSFKNLDTL